MFYVADRFFLRSAIAGFDILFVILLSEFQSFIWGQGWSGQLSMYVLIQEGTRSLYIFAIAAGGVVQRFLLDRKVGGDENFKQKSLV